MHHDDLPAAPARRTLVRALAALALGLPLAAAATEPLLRDRAPADRPKLLVIGTQHFANYNRDVVNTSVPDVMTPQRQQEMAAVAEALRRFRPTHVAVEWRQASQHKLDARYAAYRAGSYRAGPSETDQLGLRIAALENLPRVWAVDWNEMPPGQMADYDYVTWAEANGAGARLAAMRSTDAAKASAERMQREAVGQWLAHDNSPQALEDSHRRYFDYVMLGDASANPGANWVAGWHGRNLRIFANLVRLGSGPHDRVLVVYGQGHAYLLKQFARQSGAFEVVEAQAYLPAPAPR